LWVLVTLWKIHVDTLMTLMASFWNVGEANLLLGFCIELCGADEWAINYIVLECAVHDDPIGEER